MSSPIFRHPIAKGSFAKYANVPAASRGEIRAPSRFNPDVPPDLDVIAMKALRNEAEERYASVDAFAGDVRALLEHRPVLARSANAW
jgi:hypothetical protein